MLSADNLLARARMACASDIPAILNRSPFRDATLDSTMRKKLRSIRGTLEPLSSMAFRRGNYLEVAVAELCIDNEFGDGMCFPMTPQGALADRCKFVHGATMVHKNYPQYGATVDFVVAMRGFVEHETLREPFTPVEVKTSNRWDGWESGVPEHVWIQVQWQMFVLSSWGLDVKQTMVCALVCSDPVVRWVSYDRAFIDSILPTIDHFLGQLATHEVNGTEPESQEKEDRQEIVVGESVARAISDLVDIKRNIKTLKAEGSRISDFILDSTPQGVYGRIRTDGARVSIFSRERVARGGLGDVTSRLVNRLLGAGVSPEEVSLIVRQDQAPASEPTRCLYVKPS